jgi:hypothetical protein
MSSTRSQHYLLGGGDNQYFASKKQVMLTSNTFCLQVLDKQQDILT